MVSSRENSGSRHGGHSKNKTKSTTTAGMNNEENYVWKERHCQIMLELIITELKSNDHSSRMPNVAGRKRVENKLFELTAEKVVWDNEIKSKIEYLHKLWQINKQLMEHTSIVVDPSTGQIIMSTSWWTDRIAEFGNKEKFVRVLKNKPLPFKDLLDQIYGHHDVDQDERYSPFTFGVHLQETQSDLVNTDEIVILQTQEDQSTEPSLDVTNLVATTNQVLETANQKTSGRRPPRRRSHFETQVENEFQRVLDTREELLQEPHSRKIQKLSDAAVVLEKLPTEQLETFWWEANKLLKKDPDIREAFIKLESEEIKIKYMENLVGIDRYGYPCNNINLQMITNFVENSQQLDLNVYVEKIREQAVGFSMSPHIRDDITCHHLSQDFENNSEGSKVMKTNFTVLLGMTSSELGESMARTPVINLVDSGDNNID